MAQLEATPGAPVVVNKGELFSSFDVNAFEVPGGRDENWRFTPLRRLRGLHDGTATATGHATVTVTDQPGVTVETVGRDDERLGQAGVPADRVAAQAYSSFERATILTVARGTEVEHTVKVVIDGPGEGEVAYGHLQIRVEELARAIVVVDLRGSGTYADNVELIVGDAAALGVIWIADWAPDMVQVSAHQFMARRASLGMTRRRVRMESEPGRREWMSMLAGISLVVVICLGALLWSFIRPAGSVGSARTAFDGTLHELAKVVEQVKDCSALRTRESKAVTTFLGTPARGAAPSK